MEIPSHVDSHYAALAGNVPVRAALAGEVSCDVCVVGGGLAGLTCAEDLARAGMNVVLLEGRRIGWGASGRNGGFVSAGFAADWNDVLARVDLDHARKLHALSQSGVDYVRSVLMDEGCGDLIQGQGGLLLHRSGNLAKIEKSVRQTQIMFGEDREIISGFELRKLVNSDTYVAGVKKKNTFHIDPLGYANLLAKRAERQGAQLFESSMVNALQRVGDEWLTTTAQGRVTARHVVLATSAYGTPFAPLRRAVVPVSTYVMVSKPAGELLRSVITFPGTISDTRRAGDYYRLIGQEDDTRLLWGGRITTRKSEPVRLAEALLGDILAIYPQLEGLEVERAWSGWMGYARHKMPLIGQFWPQKSPNLWALTAFGGHGLNTTAMGGLLVSGAIARGEAVHALFSPWQPVTTGGLFGQAAVQASYFAMQAQDWWAEWRMSRR
jgi:glycine/D-amino acid oxidase-like deaminating enzyme